MNQTIQMLKLHSDMYFIPLSKLESENIESNLNEYKYIKKIRPNTIKLDNMNIDLYDKYRITYDNIVGIGDTKIEGGFCNKVIENIKVNKSQGVDQFAYKCHCKEDWKDKALRYNMILHEDGRSSWMCLMQKLNNPKYGVIINIKDKEN